MASTITRRQVPDPAELAADLDAFLELRPGACAEDQIGCLVSSAFSLDACRAFEGVDRLVAAARALLPADVGCELERELNDAALGLASWAAQVGYAARGLEARGLTGCPTDSWRLARVVSTAVACRAV
jgi:hypothetical protein